MGIYLAVLGLAILVIVMCMRRMTRRTAVRDPRPGTFGDTPAGLKEELEHILVEIRDASREELARLDTRMRMLQQLLAECDRKAKELEEIIGRASAAAGGQTCALEPMLLYVLSVSRWSDQPGGAPQPPGAAAQRQANPLHDRVYALADSGKDVNEICAGTGLEKGEVELILGLRRMPPHGSIRSGQS